MEYKQEQIDYFRKKLLKYLNRKKQDINTIIKDIKKNKRNESISDMKATLRFINYIKRDLFLYHYEDDINGENAKI